MNFSEYLISIENPDGVDMEVDDVEEAWDYQQKIIDELTKELDQQRFNSKHNLSIDQKVSDRIKELEKALKDKE